MHTIAEPISPTPEGERATPIAIVGPACRFPDADDPLNLFESVLAGRRSFRRLPPGRLGVAAAGGQPPRAALLEGWQFSQAELGVAKTAYRAAAGWADGTPPRLDATRDADWARVRAGKITVAGTVAALDGVPHQVAIALATCPEGDEREAGGPAASEHGASKDTGPTTDEPSGRPAGTGGRLGRPGDSFGRPGDTPGRHSVVS